MARVSRAISSVYVPSVINRFIFVEEIQRKPTSFTPKPGDPHSAILFILSTDTFAHRFQQSIDKGEIPKEWSLANICPLFKRGDRSLACNYRPVSLTCVPCKLLEHIVCSNIMAHLDEHRLLSEKQHAFRKWHSCET